MPKPTWTLAAKMKIGILTYHRSHNYGALLQAVGLREYLEGQGHEAYFIDYWPNYHRKMYVPLASLHTPDLSLRGRISGVIQDAILFPLRRGRIKAFNAFIEQYISPYCRPTSDCFDCIVCGSDQIWRRQRGLEGRFNPIYFGGGDTEAGHYISYAGSMGSVSINNDDKETLRKLFSNLQAVSVREKQLADLLISEGIVSDAEVVVDPTILLGTERWKEMTATVSKTAEGKYVLYYKLMYDSFDDEAIRRFAESKGLKLILLEGNVRREDLRNGSITDADPMQMLRLIADAEYVFTSSYHGLVFSLLFGRQVFCAFKENADRARSLLSALDIPERLIGKGTPLPDATIDYARVASRLEGLAASSRKWLGRNLVSNPVSDT